MASIVSSNPQWRERLLAYFPAPLRTLVQGASGRDLIKKINTTFLLHDSKLTHLESGKAVQPGGDSAQALAKACASLLNKEEKENPILLLLPANEFVATTVHMPGMGRDNIRSALQIQSDTILPSFEESLVLAVNPASTENKDEHTALWITENRLNKLFTAFAEEDVFLAAIKPRLLNNRLLAPVDKGESKILDCDASTMTYAVLQNGVLNKWLHVKRDDLQKSSFKEQWQKATSINIDAENNSQTTLELSHSEDYFDQADKNSNTAYCFYPQGALSATKRVEKGKRFVVAAAVAVAFLFVAAIPFIMQGLEFRSLAATLESQRQMAGTARQDQQVVVSFENEWGLINDYPEQRIREAMITLQNILSPDSLTSMEVSEGLIKIQGTSSEPQAILQRLEQDPMFTEVIFSRATNNSRYYIDLRLSTVNFEAYMVRYFPDE